MEDMSHAQCFFLSLLDLFVQTFGEHMVMSLM